MSEPIECFDPNGSGFVHKSQLFDNAKPIAKPVAGVCLADGCHVSVRKVGWLHLKREVITDFQIVLNGEVLNSYAMTAEAARSAKLKLATFVGESDCAYLSRAIDEIVKAVLR